MTERYLSHSEADTARVAGIIADSVFAPALVCLYGDLGAGKSVFARAFIRKLTHPDQTVPSPTFTLVQTYESVKGTLYHFDLYRVENADDIFELGWEEALAENIVIVEWPQRAIDFLPAKRIDITLSPLEGGHREILIHDTAKTIQAR